MAQKKPAFWPLWPAYALLAALGYETVLNAASALRPAEGGGAGALAVSPDIAFNWLQAAAGGGMWLLLLWALLLARKGLRQSALGLRLPWTLPRTLAALTLALFALPAWRLWFWTAAGWLSGRQGADWGNWHYVLAALCQPFVLLIPLLWWRAQRRLRRRPAPPPVLPPRQEEGR